MARRLIALVVSLLLVCSAFGAVARTMVPAWDDDSPATLQVASTGHHHHESTGDSDAAAQHLECCGADGVNDAALIAPTWPDSLGQAPRATPAERPFAALPTPFLEGPRRPPRS